MYAVMKAETKIITIIGVTEMQEAQAAQRRNTPPHVNKSIPGQKPQVSYAGTTLP